MRLDKPGDDPQIGLDDVPVEQCRRAVRRGADLHQRLRVFRLVIEYAVVGDDFRREHCLQFLPRVGPVRAELVQQRDVVIWPAEMLEQPGDDSVVRRRAGKVREGDANLRGRRDAIEQRLAADRFLQRVDDGFFFIGQAVDVRWLDDRRAIVGNFDGKMAGTVCQVDCHAKRGGSVTSPANQAKRVSKWRQFHERSSGPSASRRCCQSSPRRISRHAASSGLLKTSSVVALQTSHALRASSLSSWPPPQPE